MALPESYGAALYDLEKNSEIIYKGVIQDGLITILEETFNAGKVAVSSVVRTLPYRFLSLQDGTRIEYPMDRYRTVFDSDRTLVVNEAVRLKKLSESASVT
ncbi:MAG: hypothetical protein MUP21_02085 [Dehalococcoidia bacterium]|nr:hypothetical protein [Dehalococcoidia bacterium]